MAISTAAAILGGSALSAGVGMFSAKKAADVQAGAADRASALQYQMFQQGRRDLRPWRRTGKNALRQLSRMFIQGKGMGRFRQTPGYKFRFGEGVRALDRSASARGRLMSGGHERELTRYGQRFASEEFGNYANRLAALAGIGQAATTQTAQLGQQAGANMGNALMQAGTARASGYVGAANALTGGVNNALFMYGGNKGWWN